MNPEVLPPDPRDQAALKDASAAHLPVAEGPLPEFVAAAPGPSRMEWLFLNGEGALRSGWSVLLFLAVVALTLIVTSILVEPLFDVLKANHLPLASKLFGAVLEFVAVLIGGLVLARVEQRSIFDYNLRGASRVPHFLSGLAAGFAALGLLVGLLRITGGVAVEFGNLHGAEVLRYALLWGFVFVLVALSEEGTCRCALQVTLTRGLSFGRALLLVAALCATLIVRGGPSGSGGVWIFALLGLPFCWWLERQRVDESNFWQAAWVVSTFFGWIHISNSGESSMGIFAAALVGFIFTLSIRMTGSAWWAIGCHAAWDWSETFLFGTADSGMKPEGSLFISHPSGGNTLLSGGSVGPEGSLLVVPVLVLLMVLLISLYGRQLKTA